MRLRRLRACWRAGWPAFTTKPTNPPSLQELRPLADPLVFGNYNVAYVSAGSRQGGQPAGGRFRGGLGKLLFRTTCLAQSVLQPDIVTNKVLGWVGVDGWLCWVGMGVGVGVGACSKRSGVW